MNDYRAENFETIARWVDEASEGKLRFVADEKGGDWHTIRFADGSNLIDEGVMDPVRRRPAEEPVIGMGWRYYVSQSFRLSKRYRTYMADVAEAVRNFARIARDFEYGTDIVGSLLVAADQWARRNRLAREENR